MRRVLDLLIKGRRIEDVHLFWPRTLQGWTIEQFRSRVTDRSIAGVGRRGKLLLLRLDDESVITVHLRMTGELLFRPAAAAPRDERRAPYLRAALDLSGDAELLFYDIRKFGRIGLLDDVALNHLGSALGYEPLDPAFTPDALAAILAGRERRIKPLLLDQSVIAGLGNIYVDESLFRAGIHPLLSSRLVDADRVRRLHEAIVDILATAVELQGTTVRDYRTGAGERGSNQARLRVYGLKPGTPCPRCATPLERLVVAQRGTIFCPICQPLLTPDTPGR